MNASHLATHAPLSTRGTPRARKTIAAPVVDLYGPVHKGLRFAFGRTLSILGTCDVADPQSVRSGLDAVTELLDLCAHHLKHENEHLLSAIAARRPGAEHALAEDHDEHVRAITTLRAEVARCAEAGARLDAHAWHQLYLQLAFFVGENLTHMNEEETLAQPLLHEIYSAEELLAIEHRLVSSIAPDVLGAFLRVMLPGLPLAGRVALLAGPRGAMPPEVFPQWLASMVVHLSRAEAEALFAALGLDRVALGGEQ